MIRTHCLLCVKSLTKSVYAGDYCSRKCKDEHEYELYIHQWLHGLEDGGSPGRISKRVRRWIFERRGEECENCGWSEAHPITGKSPLEVNHIDGNPNNHRPDNLEILCPNCHSLTDHHGCLNRGNGRKLGVQSTE